MKKIILLFLLFAVMGCTNNSTKERLTVTSEKIDTTENTSTIKLYDLNILDKKKISFISYC